MSQAIIPLERKEPTFLPSISSVGRFNHHKVEDLTQKCEVGVKKLRREANLECVKAIGYGILAALAFVIVVALAVKIAFFVVGLLALSHTSILAVGLRALIGASVGFAAGKIFLAPILLRAIEHQDRAQNRFNLSHSFRS